MFISVKALVQQYAFMAFASHFYHGSETDLALKSDVRFADLGTFTAYQANTRSFPQIKPLFF